LFKTHRQWTEQFMAEPTVLGCVARNILKQAKSFVVFRYAAI
jgi:hypothetical protein